MPIQTADEARAVAALVPMARLLESMGFQVNERTRRGCCPIHGGSNTSVFSWREDGRWHCFSCQHGGDRIALVRAVNKCSFREAVEFLATLAGVQYDPGSVSRESVEHLKLIREREVADADALLRLEFVAWRTAQDAVLQFETIRRNAVKRLEELHRGERERWPNESEIAWEALAEVYGQMSRTAAAYNIISFGRAEDRFAFALDADARASLIDEALERGWVADSKGYRIEVQL